jgi:hypothetical protein
MVFHKRKNTFSTARHDFVQKFVTLKLHDKTIRFYSVTIVNKSKSFRWDRHVAGVAIQGCIFYRQRVKKNCFVEHPCFCTVFEFVTEGLYRFKLRTSQNNLTFTGPCIVIYSNNKSQRDVLFLKGIYCLLARSKRPR